MCCLPPIPILVVLGLVAAVPTIGSASEPAWTSPHRFRVLLSVDNRGRVRSHAPAAVELDFQTLLGNQGEFDRHSLEVVALDVQGAPRVYDGSRTPNEQPLVPNRLDEFYGSTKKILNFVLRDHQSTRYAVYFDVMGAGRGRPDRFGGMVGDGDRFREQRQSREINACHFDQFVDFDGDGDLDLFKGGVEPFVYVYENLGQNRFVDRGRLTSGGELFTLPHSSDNRGWATVAFYDMDGDGDQDFFPSFQDGPDRGQFVCYRNETRELGGQLTFRRLGILRTVAGVPLAGGDQSGGWFPSIVFVRDFDGEPSRRLDAIVGSGHRCWLYRGAGTHADGSPSFNSAPAAIRAGLHEIKLVNPRFELADVHGHGRLDLLAGTQPGKVYLFPNIGTRPQPKFAPGQPVAFTGDYLIADAHSGVKAADFDGDGLLDLVAGRFWERSNWYHWDEPRDLGGYFHNDGTATEPRWVRTTKGAPAVDEFPICDAVRQNCVHAIDWDGDGKLDLLAGDTDGFVWYFRQATDPQFPLFEPPQKLRTRSRPLNVVGLRGHARFDVTDWNQDGMNDLLVATGNGALMLFPRIATRGDIQFGDGESTFAASKTIQGGARASVLACDWDHDGRQDIVLADEKGYSWFRNVGTKTQPSLAAAKPILFAGKPVTYVRPNLGSFVDWDGDGKRDFIGCNFENNVRLYRDLGNAASGEEPTFRDPEGEVILRASSPQMISGAQAIDWNGDGDLDLLTGQGHGGSGLRFFERDWLEDEIHHSHPHVTAGPLETKAK